MAVALIVSTLRAFIAVEQLFFLARAVLSWIPSLQGSGLDQFLYQMTEPLIAPVRSVVMRSESMRRLPIDISFMIAYLLLMLAESLLLRM